MFVSGRMLYKKFKCIKYCNEFYLGEERGGALMHVYKWEHIVSIYFRTA